LLWFKVVTLMWRGVDQVWLELWDG